MSNLSPYVFVKNIKFIKFIGHQKKVPDMHYYLSITFVGENYVGTRQLLKYDFNLPCISNAREHVYLGWKCQNRCGKRSQKHVGH